MARTQPKEAHFLLYNKEEIFKALIAGEGHFRNLEKGIDIGMLNCVVKHLADAEGHADEAISHSLSLGDKKASGEWVKLRDKIRGFRRHLQEKSVNREEGIKEIRELRHQFEAFNVEYDISKCKSCGDIEDFAKILGHESLGDIEDEMADRILAVLSEKYGVAKPKLIISKECRVKDPQTSGWFWEWSKKEHGDNAEIEMCRGGVNAHVLMHEFHHYLAYLGREDQDEDEIEEKAIAEFAHSQKTLNAKNTHINVGIHSGGSKMKYGKSAVAVLGGQLISQGIQEYEGSLEATMGQDIVTGIEVVGGGAALVLGATGKIVKSEVGSLVLLVTGGGLLIHGAMRAIKKLSAPAARLPMAPSMPYIPSPTGMPGGMAYQGASAGATLSAPVPGTRMYGGITRLTAGYPGVAQVDSKFINVKV